jgi:acetylornithine deacetylase/succinyl-diaminopimelate desuccinylase-like protein
MRLTARARAGHGSMIHDDNAVTVLAEATARLGRHKFPVVLAESVEQFLQAVAEETGYTFDLNAPDLEGAIAKLGPIAKIVGATLRDTANPTMLKAGYKANVIPATAEAVVDCRILPGRLAEFEREVDEIIGPDVAREWITDLPAYETGFDGELLDAMNNAILATDPDARTVPYMLSAGTDAKHFARLGIRCFGFVPLKLPPDLDFAALFHGVDERVPVDALTFGAEVLERTTNGFSVQPLRPPAEAADVHPDLRVIHRWRGLVQRPGQRHHGRRRSRHLAAVELVGISRGDPQLRRHCL